MEAKSGWKEEGGREGIRREGEEDMKENRSRAFASEAELEKAYVRFLGNLEDAGDMIRDRHARMESSFSDYLDAFERWVFRHAYEYGYEVAMSRARGMDKAEPLERTMRDMHCPRRMARIYQVTSNFGHYLYRDEQDAIHAVVMLAPYHGMEILEEEVKAYLDMYGCYNAGPIVVQKCDC